MNSYRVEFWCVGLTLALALSIGLAHAQAAETAAGGVSLEAQRSVLEEFSRATGLTAWKTKAAANSSVASVCSWTGVTCVDDGSARVSRLRLHRVGLVGTLPESLAVLGSQLTLLDVSYNEGLSGSVPASYGEFTELTELYMQVTSISAVPGSLNRLRKLVVFSFFDTPIRSLPPQLFARGFPELYFFTLSNTNVFELPDTFGPLPALTGVEVKANKQLTLLPASLFANAPAVLTIRISGNPALVSIPETIGTAGANVTDFMLMNCPVQSVPASVGNLTSLHKIILIGTRATQLPWQLERLTLLSEFFCSDNPRLTSLPPNIFSRMASLLELHMNDNALTALPSVYANTHIILRALRNRITAVPGVFFSTHFDSVTLFLRSNQISGFSDLPPLPDRMLTFLSLNLAVNKLTHMPPHLCYLSEADVDLSNNELTSLPDCIGRVGPVLGSNGDLLVASNRLTSLPPDFMHVPNLRRVSLADNKLVKLPRVNFTLEKVYAISVARNHMVSLVDDWSKFPSLSTLYAADNAFGTDVLERLTRGMHYMPTLRTVYLGDNQVSGVVSLANFSRGSIVDLQRNAIEGVVELSPSISQLYLNDNRLSSYPQPLSVLFGASSKISLVALDGNRLTSLPPMLQSESLVTLRLSDNLISGVEAMNASEWNAPRLDTLDLHGNRLTRFLPDALVAKLPVLAGLHVYANPIRGTIPEVWPPKLEVLELTDMPYVSGTIPASIGDMVSLKTLEVSSTNVTAVHCRILFSRYLERVTIHRNPTLSHIVGACQHVPSSEVAVLDLDLSKNGLQHNLAQLSLPASMSSLDVSGNRLSGQLTDLPLGAMSARLASLSVTENEISGALTQPLAKLQNLRTLRAGMNGFQGTLPDEIPAKLASVDVSDNPQLSGCVPNALLNSTNLLNLRVIGSTGLRNCFPELLVPRTVELVRSVRSRLVCPSWRSTSGGSLDVSPAFTGMLGCRCDDGQYYDRDADLCRSCPANLRCDPAAVDPVHTVMPGFFVPDDGTVDALECYSRSFCNPDGAVQFACGERRRQGSRLCAECDSESFAFAQQCFPCSAAASWLSLVLVLGAAALVALQLVHAGLEPQPVALVVWPWIALILVAHRFAFMLGDSTGQTAFQPPDGVSYVWPVLHSVQVFQMPPPAMQCWHDPGVFGGVVASVVASCGLLVVVAGASFAVHQSADALAESVGSAVYVAATPLAALATSLLNCSDGYLVVSPHVECSESQRVVGWTVLCALLLAYPAWLVAKRPRFSVRQFRSPYRSYWFFVAHARNMTIGCAWALFTRKDGAHACLLFSGLLANALLHLGAHPYRLALCNTIESTFGVLALLSFLTVMPAGVSSSELDFAISLQVLSVLQWLAIAAALAGSAKVGASEAGSVEEEEEAVVGDYVLLSDKGRSEG